MIGVYVRNHDGAALMPCTPAKARKLLRAGRAKVVAYRPFTIQLAWQCEGKVQEVTCGIDKGSSITGVACVGNGTVLLAAEIHHRRDVKNKMEDRRDRRKSRRARLWYLEAHHLIFRQNGGKDTLTNLLTLCEGCHHQLHEGKITLKATGVGGHLDQIAQRTMQGKTHLYTTLGSVAPLKMVFGYETAAYRTYRNLPKTHIIDALCIATLTTGEVVAPPERNIYHISFRPRQTRKRYHSLPQKGKGRVKYQVNDELQGFRKGDLVLVKEKYIKLVNSIYSTGYLGFPRVKGEPNVARPQDCRIVEREGTVLWKNVEFSL